MSAAALLKTRALPQTCMRWSSGAQDINEPERDQLAGLAWAKSTCARNLALFLARLVHLTIFMGDHFGAENPEPQATSRNPGDSGLVIRQPEIRRMGLSSNQGYKMYQLAYC